MGVVSLSLYICRALAPWCLHRRPGSETVAPGMSIFKNFGIQTGLPVIWPPKSIQWRHNLQPRAISLNHPTSTQKITHTHTQNNKSKIYHSSGGEVEGVAVPNKNNIWKSYFAECLFTKHLDPYKRCSRKIMGRARIDWLLISLTFAGCVLQQWVKSVFNATQAWLCPY